MSRPIVGSRRRNGFTLVELAVVIVIIGVLAAFGVPRFLQSVEKSKAAEAFNYGSTVQSAQERYLAQKGVYAGAAEDLDITLPTLQYFDATMSAVADDEGAPDFLVTLTRKAGSSSYGEYTVIWKAAGFDPTTSDIPEGIRPVTIVAAAAPSGG